MSSIALLIIGLLLVLLEFYLPGAIMGIAGGILIIISIILHWLDNPSALSMFLFVVGAIVGVIAVVRFAIWQIPRTANRSTFYLNKDQHGYKASSFDAHAIGKKGVALSDLKPGGYILIDGKKQQALSVSGYVNKGSEVEVISGKEESLIVKQSSEEILS
jgi:membrane-bound serine protease (ClpP class)